jgi:uncharacterized protein with HEPN domain
MNDRSPLDWLNDARGYAREASDIVRGLEEHAFARSRRDQLAVQFCLAIAGEALNQIPRDIQALAPEIPWVRIRGLRNRLVHSFFLIDHQIVLGIAQHDTEPLALAIDRLIEKIK